ncbi:hypothetical protein J7443_02960 [Tropicibacter sp. R15_0]|uniref:deiodinase-like protein n=1 Tax=Tropicibacter sp. R15_0 TaxID=2821101 RepID=UPI001ADC8A0B|nr:deiodinase-like protein [Tropicibacter sp. R15_0]MBO9464177.1 hypothetical protein [Tropicibacter sp. R15_0]
MAYNYSNFDASEYDLVNFRGPQPGSKAPDFEIDLATGGVTRLLDFEGDFLVLEMGSLTCPLFQGRREVMTRLDRQHPDVSFAVLYVREAHPGSKIPAHITQGDKASCAATLVADGENRRVLVDDIAGRVHQAYGGYPNSVFIINRHGCVVYAVDWNNPAVTGRAIELLKAGKPAALRAWFKPVPPKVSLKVLGEGGKGSMSDFLRGLPNLIWNNLVRRNLRLAFGRKGAVAPDVQC